MLVSIRLHPRDPVLRDGCAYINEAVRSVDGEKLVRRPSSHLVARRCCLLWHLRAGKLFLVSRSWKLGVPQQASSSSYQAIDLAEYERHCQNAFLRFLRSGFAVDQCHYAASIPASASRKRYQAPDLQHHHRQPRPIDALDALIQLGRHRR